MLASSAQHDDLYGDFNTNAPMNHVRCFTQSYMPLFFSSNANYSCCTSALFRFFRVAFYRRKDLRTFPFPLLLICLQWTPSMLALCSASIDRKQTNSYRLHNFPPGIFFKCDYSDHLVDESQFLRLHQPSTSALSIGLSLILESGAFEIEWE